MRKTAITDNAAMGKIVVTLTLTNWADTVLAERGFIPEEEVRDCVLDDAVVGTGATRLCLPANVIQQLGLKLVGTIGIQTATGAETARVYAGLILNIEGREGRYDCVELPAGSTPLLGLIPLEDLGLDPDLQTQRLRHLPDKGKESYMLVL